MRNGSVEGIWFKQVKINGIILKISDGNPKAMGTMKLLKGIDIWLKLNLFLLDSNGYMLQMAKINTLMVQLLITDTAGSRSIHTVTQFLAFYFYIPLQWFEINIQEVQPLPLI